MAEREITVLTDVALITCIVQKGQADALVKAARGAGAQGATVYYARGTGIREQLGLLSVAVDAEKEVVNIVVARDQVDRVFERVYLEGNLDAPGMGFIYVVPLEKAATYVPAEVQERLRRKASA
jgi:nitrogen regulatory protein PII